jgi:hypothetical protein
METFTIVMRKDEKEYGEFRTKRAMETVVPYETSLDPPPADAAVRHAGRESRETFAKQ